MNTIQKVSSYFLVIFNILLISLPLCIFLQWAFIDTKIVKELLKLGLLHNKISTPTGCTNLSSMDWNLLSMITGFTSHLLGQLPFILSLFILKSIFRSYQTGEIFTTSNAILYKYLGYLFFLDALIAKPISELLMVLTVTMSNPPGHRYISISFGIPNLEALFCGMLVIVISWVMVEASKLADIEKLTI